MQDAVLACCDTCNEHSRRTSHYALLPREVAPAGGAAPEPRESHCACMLSRFLLVAGGMAQMPNGALRPLGDLHVRHYPDMECASADVRKTCLVAARTCSGQCHAAPDDDIRVCGTQTWCTTAEVYLLGCR